MDERRRRAALDFLCSRLVRAMCCFSFRPDWQHGVSSGNQCYDQNLCQHNTDQQKKRKQTVTNYEETATNTITDKMSKQQQSNTEAHWI